MGLSFTGKKRIRKNFGRIPEAVEMPNLIEVQKHSYEQFLMKDTAMADRPDEGLQAVFGRGCAKAGEGDVGHEAPL
ncbi:MAG: hypothetical protein ACOC20_02120, partial [Oceanicaulis sp.]